MTLFRSAAEGRRDAVLGAEGDRHDRLAGEDAVAQYLALQRLGEELHADLPPGVADQLQHVDFLVVLAGGLDDDLQRAAVGQQAIAVAVALGQADLVEQRVGFRGVEGGISLAVRRLRSEEHTSELQSLMRISYAVFCLKKKKDKKQKHYVLITIHRNR